VIAAGGVVLFPSDTVYGLACDPQSSAAIERLYAIKRRPPDKSAAVMFFSLDACYAALPELGPGVREAIGRLCPGGVTLLLENSVGRFPLACRADPGTLGIRVIDVPAMAAVEVPVLQSSANLSGGPDARRLADVDPAVRGQVDLELDGGELPGVPSTVIDLRGYEQRHEWSIVRPGALSEAAVAAALDGQFHFDPSSYEAMIRDELPGYEQLHDELVAACEGTFVTRVLDLGTGTGGTARRVLERFPHARLIGLDESAAMLAAAELPQGAELRVGRLQDPLPDGPFELVVSALAVHHLDEREKAELFRRVAAVLAPGGRFVLADVVAPEDPDEAAVPLTPGFDKPSPAAEQLQWLGDAGLRAAVRWAHRDLAVIVAEHP
jgi:tRNA threonylcarbamoyl adenosine modification protein (Sua5/YciO/YrdC/YwlC family)